MSEVNATPVAAPAAEFGGGVSQAPAKPLTAIQMLEQELANFFKQREQAIANVHAVEGAIQATQHLLMKLRAEEIKAIDAAKTAAAAVEGEAKKVESKVVSIADTAVKKL